MRFRTGTTGASGRHVAYITRERAVIDRERAILLYQLPEHVRASADYRELRQTLTRDLTPEEREEIDHALLGYLKHLEEAFQQDLREDYPIFPGGKLKYDVPPSRWPKRGRPGGGDEKPTRRAKPTVSDRPIGKRGLVDLFHQLEEVAGVMPQPGRGWYGIRRKPPMCTKISRRTSGY